jgi:hypothetical protein
MWYVNGLCRDVPFEITPDSADSCRVGYRTGIAVTPENDDLSDVRLTRAHRGAGRNDTSSSSIVYYYKGAPVYPDARPTPSPSKTGSKQAEHPDSLLNSLTVFCPGSNAQQ